MLRCLSLYGLQYKMSISDQEAFHFFDLVFGTNNTSRVHYGTLLSGLMNALRLGLENTSNDFLRFSLKQIKWRHFFQLVDANGAGNNENTRRLSSIIEYLIRLGIKLGIHDEVQNFN